MVKENRDFSSFNKEIDELIRENFRGYIIEKPSEGIPTAFNERTVHLRRGCLGLIFGYDHNKFVEIQWARQWRLNNNTYPPEMRVRVNRESELEMARKFSEEYEKISGLEVTITQTY